MLGRGALGGSVVKFSKDDPQLVSENAVFLGLPLGTLYRENRETSAQQRKEKEKGELVKRDSIPQSPCWKSRSEDELDWQEEAARPGIGP